MAESKPAPENPKGAPLSSYLSHPGRANEQPAQRGSAANSSAEATKSGNRLYVGNLHPSVDEYVLIQTFSKYGKIAKLDFLFHKTGPMRGKPRGYAFVEYSKNEEALQAIIETNDRTLRGKKLMVTLANQSQLSEPSHSSSGVGPHRRRDADTFKPTTLSLIKNASLPESTNAKISAMEAKLAQLRHSRGKPSSSSSSSSNPQAKGVASLPSKPPAPSGSSDRGP
ncbi:hypothetical protein ACQY0O_005878 [Thecaphora frezii]